VFQAFDTNHNGFIELVLNQLIPPLALRVD